MQDELLLRQWTAAHGQFSADIDRLLGKIRAWLVADMSARPTIGRTYAAGARRNEPSLRSAQETLLGGLAAVVTTVLLFTAVVLVAEPAPATGGIASSSVALAGEWKTASSSAPGLPA